MAHDGFYGIDESTSQRHKRIVRSLSIATDKSSSSSSRFKVPLKKPNSVKNKGKKSNGNPNNAKLLKQVRDRDK